MVKEDEITKLKDVVVSQCKAIWYHGEDQLKIKAKIPLAICQEESLPAEFKT